MIDEWNRNNGYHSGALEPMSIMKRRTAPARRAEPETPFHRFASAEEAWYWFMRCEKARAEGARSERRGAYGERPCAPADIMRWVSQLYYADVLFPLHLQVMGEYGYLDEPPDPEQGVEATVDYLIWFDAFQKLEPFLRRKGVVE